ncbi:MAG TPA: hypothetical protein DIC30_04380 [Oceanospirillales bacterium]|jgi:hypothetical protein|nr:hypothetical protein [Oleispira sp.]HCM05226.1 hypothetical protein [Oceanospirillales bacterium]|tara:strand:- start:2442 stop:3170 length:729 start_codon:yes stop_codon:yes gene_type:complete
MINLDLLIEFIIACLIMGCGIGADVAIATFVRAQQLSKQNQTTYWITGVTLTHTIFPMFGYLLAYFSIQSIPLLTPIIGVLAFSFIAYFLWQELNDYLKSDEDHQDERQSLVTFALILAVSWDALWSGPAKSAQVMNWPDELVWVSFLVVGFIVALCAYLGLLLAKKFNQMSSEFSTFIVLGLWIQYSVIAYFGFLALIRYTLSIMISGWQVFIISSVMVAIIMTLLFIKNEKSQLSQSSII